MNPQWRCSLGRFKSTSKLLSRNPLNPPTRFSERTKLSYISALWENEPLSSRSGSRYLLGNKWAPPIGSASALCVCLWGAHKQLISVDPPQKYTCLFAEEKPEIKVSPKRAMPKRNWLAGTSEWPSNQVAQSAGSNQVLEKKEGHQSRFSPDAKTSIQKV